MRTGAWGLCGMVVLTAACSVTPEKITQWKETERGPAKLRAAVGNGSLSPALRGMALAALVEIGMQDEIVADLPAGGAEPLVHDAVPRLERLLGPPAPRPIPRVERDAKDALFLLRARAGVADRLQIDQALIRWATADLSGRMSVGGEGTQKIFATIGTPVAPALLPLLVVGSPDLSPAARFIGQLGDAATRAQAAKSLVAILRSAPARAEDTQLVEALSLVDSEVGRQYLYAAARGGSEHARELALLALAQGPVGPGTLAGTVTLAVDLAGDPHAPGRVREAAFQLAEKQGPLAASALLSLIHSAPPLVRWRAVEAALAAGKSTAIRPVLETLPDGSYTKDDVDSYVVHDLALVGPSAVGPLKEVIAASTKPIARACAVAALARLGHASDGAVLTPLLSDHTPLRGWKPPTTLGAEAVLAAQALKTR